MQSKTWPAVDGRYIVGNTDSPVAVCTLSSVAMELPMDKIAISGKCVTENIGIEKIVKNIVSNPKIRYLLICGKISMGHFVENAIVSLIEKGVDSDKRIVGAKGGIPILKNLSIKEIERFREQVTPVDMADETDTEKIMEKVDELFESNPGPFWGEAIFPEVMKTISAGENEMAYVPDPSGYFTIHANLQNKEIIVEYYNNDGKLNLVITGKKAGEIYESIIKHGLVSRFEHAAYLGKELTKAEIAISRNIDYEQDASLNFMLSKASFIKAGIQAESANEENIYQPLVVRGESLGEAWENAVRTMMKSGYNRFVKAPEYQTWTKDSPMIILVSDPMKEPRLSPKAPLTISMADEYSESLIHGHAKDKENSFEYTYYSRLRHYPDCLIRAGLPHISDEQQTKDYIQKVSGGKCIVQRLDQVAEAIRIFKKDPTRRTVVLHTWVPMRDLAKFTPERIDTSSPCLVLLHPQIVENKLHMNVVMKTNDLYNAWPGNAYAFSALQKYMADQLGIGVGHYTHFSVAMQIYQDAYSSANKI